jgi:hypothetical protein
VKVVTFPLPPLDFDPLTAADEALRRYGCPRRPDPVAEPVLRRLWDRALSQRPKIVAPTLVETTAWRSRPYAGGSKKRSGIGVEGKRHLLGGDGPLAGEWAGGIIDLGLPLQPGQEPFNYVYGEWKVPTFDTHPAQPGSQTIGFWIGLGGWNTLGPSGLQSLLQAGVCATITGNSVEYFVVTEWAPATWKVTNFDVAAGDLITMLVCAPQVDLGFELNAFVMMLNGRTKNAMVFGISNPDNVPTDGSTAEWIVEAIDTEMPNFGTMSFTECAAGNQEQTVGLADMYTFSVPAQSPSGDILATANIDAAQNTVEVSWFAAT